MASKKPKAVPKNQTSVASLFSKLTVSKTEDVKVKTPENPENLSEEPEAEPILSSADTEIKEFYATLTPYERLAHEIAVEKLGTSYDVSRTHGFQRWRNARK